MSGNPSSAWKWLTAVIVAHLIVSVVHGAAHAQAQVPLSRAANLFVYIAILAGPLIGLALTLPSLTTFAKATVVRRSFMRRRKTRPVSGSTTGRIGGWLIAVTMAGSLFFGLVNHFVLSSPDHVAHVDRQWRVLFATTAVLLAVSEFVGSGLALRLVRERK